MKIAILIMKLLVLGLTGKRGSGKDTAAEYLRDEYGFRILTYTDDVLGPVLRGTGKDVVRDNLIDLALDLRKKHGKDILTKMIADKVSKEGFWAISGVRYPEEDEYFRKTFGGNYRLVRIICSTEKRYERVVKRGTKGEASMTFDKFTEIEKRETERMIEKTERVADFSIDNNGSIQDLHAGIDRLSRKLGIG